MKVPGYIRYKMHRIASLCSQASALMREVEKWLEAHGVDTSEEGLRCGDGCSLEELEYGIDITDLICDRLECEGFPEL